MTQKELLYIEDAIGHEDNIISICEQSLRNLEDEKLINFMEKQQKKHMTTKEKLINKLKENTNG